MKFYYVLFIVTCNLKISLFSQKRANIFRYSDIHTSKMTQIEY